MRYLPVFLDVQGRRALVLGVGEVAKRKAEALRRAGAEVVFADRFAPELLDGCVLAVGADAPEPELERLSAAARARCLPVNIVDRPALCSYITPAVVDRDKLIVAVGTAGEAPVLARLVRARIEAMLPPALARLAAIAGSFSAELRARFPASAARRRVLERMLDGRAAELVLAGDEAAGIAEMRREIDGASATPPGIVYLVGAGPGAADLVTMRAHRLLGEADVIVFDASVSRDVLDLARRDAHRIELEGDEAALLTRLAREGKRVVRLGARLDRALLSAALTAASVATENVPGLPSTD
jgi:uroporphyrin-III C-methyltransferase/precorrin-2 dehydrogenase/sirohydrochlorin ferrochelatase